jgi:hypothetical protein
MEIKPTLKTTMTLEDVRFYKHLEAKNSPFVSNIKKLFEEKTPILANRIPIIFDTYTLHDINHSIRVLEHCFDLVNDVTKLSDLDIVIIIYASVLHDIGMAISDEELQEIEKPDYEYKGIKYSSMLKLRNGNQKLARQDFIRDIHANRSHDYVMNERDEIYLLPGQLLINFKNEVAKVCDSHTKHHSWIVDSFSKDSIKGVFHFNLQFCSLLLRLGDLLDFDSNRTPPNLYKMISPDGFGKDEWKQHFIIQNTKKVFEDANGQKTITICGESDEPRIHRKFMQYLDWIEKEVGSTLLAIKSMGEFYQMPLNPFLDKRVETKGYSFSDKKLAVDYHAITNLLMGEKVYGDPKLGLRELIQNSIDACKIRSEIDKKNAKYGDTPYIPKIKINLNKAEGTVGIKDNGIGMNLEIITRFFLNIGKSYYLSETFLLKDYNYKPIGNFGIGFLSCFMLSNEVNVKTRHIDSDTCISIDLEKDSEYVILRQDKNILFDGTLITLDYISLMHCFDDKIENLKVFLETNFLTDGFSIELINVDDKNTVEIQNKLFLNLDSTKKNEYILPLTKYLKDLKGEVKIKYIDSFVSSIDDLRPQGKPFFYNGEDIQEINNSFDLALSYTEEIIGCFEIPIIDEYLSDDLKKYYEVLEDYCEAIERISRDAEFISIYFKPDGKSYKSSIIEDGDYIIGDIGFERLIEFGQYENSKTQVKYSAINIHKHGGLYLLFNPKYNITWVYFSNKPTWDVFVRNILIRDYIFRPETVASILGIDELKIDIFNKGIIPSVSRNNFDKETTETLNYAINKAIHCSALEHLPLNEIQKNTLKSFIAKYFSKRTFLEI